MAELVNEIDDSEIENDNVNEEEIHGVTNENTARLSITSARGSNSGGILTSDVSENHDDLSPLTGSEYGVRFMLTNARSLIPKVNSMVDAFSSLQLNFASITESRALKDWLVDLEGRSPGSASCTAAGTAGPRKQGGGGHYLQHSYLQFKNEGIETNFEVMCATGRVGKIERRVVVFAVYVPPGIKVGDLEKLRELLALEVAAAKQSYRNPIIIVNGDFNHRDVGDALCEVEKFDLLASGPTRGMNTIDLVYTNCASNIKESATLPPLQAGGGAWSDHQCVYAAAEFVPAKKFKWIVQWRRT